MGLDRRNSGLRRGRLWTALCLVAPVVVALVASSGRAQTRRTPVVPMIPTADRYQENRVFLERADKLLNTPNTDYQILVGNVEFRKGDMFMYCDSAHFYEQTSSLDAYGNVRMEQGDTLFVYGDELNYTDSIELAVLYADPGKKVRLINKDVELKTDVFNYDLGIELGFYEVGGELIDKKNRLTSIYGEYNPNTKEANFRDNVHLTSLSKGDTLNIYTEALYYNTDTHIAEMTEESMIVNADGTIYTENGRYNTETSVSDLFDRSTVVTKSGKTLTGDTLFYDRNSGYGEAFGNMILNDTVNHSMLTGDYGYYDELIDSAFVTGRALAIDYSSPDTLTLHGDTIRAFRVVKMVSRKIVPQAIADSLAGIADSVSAAAIAALPDSVEVDPETVAAEALAKMEEKFAVDSLVPDTTHYIVAAPRVRFYRRDIQGVCDSMVFVQLDSLLHMHKDPIIWSGTRQIFGNEIVVHMNDSTADRVTLPDYGFMAEMIEEGYYNQMSGKEMVAFLDNGELRHLDVSGNVLIRFFPMENDSTYNKVAQVESSFLAADFKGQAITYMKLWSETNEVITPLYLAKRSLLFLPGFKWLEWQRPKDSGDLFTTPVMPGSEPAPEAEKQVAAEVRSAEPDNGSGEPGSAEDAVPEGEAVIDESTEIITHDEPQPTGGD